MSVYVAQVAAHVKVGYSTNPEKRVQSLFQGDLNRPVMLDHSAPRVLLGLIPNGRLTDEAALHRLLEPWSVLGEWYFAEQAVLDVVEAYSRDFVHAAALVPHERVPEPTDPMHPAYVDREVRLVQAARRRRGLPHLYRWELERQVRERVPFSPADLFKRSA